MNNAERNVSVVWQGLFWLGAGESCFVFLRLLRLQVKDCKIMCKNKRGWRE